MKHSREQLASEVEALDRSSDVPLYLQLRDIFIRNILEGTWAPGTMIPPEVELGHQYGVSRGTLRQALAELEREGFVHRQQGRGTFVARAESRWQAKGLPGRTIAFIVSYVRDSFVVRLLLGVESAARERGFAVLFNHVENNVEKQAIALRSAQQQRLAGIILFPVDSVHIAPVVLELAHSLVPFVLVDRYFKGVPTDYVMSDNFGGGLRATQHLIELGHRRIGFLLWKDPAVTMEHRQNGYERALAEAGIPVDPRLICEVAGYPSIDLEGIRRFLLEEPRPTAVFAANDQLAVAVVKVCRQEGLRIPYDLALVGFDDLDMVSHLEVPLTTVAQPIFEIGRTAAEIVIDRLQGRIRERQQRVLPTTLVVRRSCGAYLRETGQVHDTLVEETDAGSVPRVI
ncbi:MAG TPA: GntR family transcriptional regulator [Anaerolineae bacterium]|nr:GntR family transcriptional regulator [Anaerolineae bacterium]